MTRNPAISEKAARMLEQQAWAHKRLLELDLSDQERALLLQMVRQIQRGDVVVVVDEPERRVGERRTRGRQTIDRRVKLC